MIAHTQIKQKSITEQYLDFLGLPSWNNIREALRRVLELHRLNAAQPEPILSYIEGILKPLIDTGILRETSNLEITSNTRDSVLIEVDEWEGEEYLRVSVNVTPDTSTIIYEYNDTSELVDEEYVEEENDEIDKRLTELMQLEYDPKMIKRFEKDWLKIEIYDSAVCYESKVNIPHTHCYPSRILRIKLPTPKLWGVLKALPDTIELLELFLSE